ncbi:hypothetical protein KIL84_012325, partial [Mauremys mutica]
FFPKPHSSVDEQHRHSLDVKLCLVFYLDRTKLPKNLASLHSFVSYEAQMSDQMVSDQTISRWITSCITSAYETYLPTLGWESPSGLLKHFFACFVLQE